MKRKQHKLNAIYIVPV